jgi:hypothetical protein
LKITQTKEKIMAITPNTPNPVREDSYTTVLATKLGIDPKYIPKSPVWRNEEEIAAIAEMFSNMAGGSSGGGVIEISVDNDTGALNKTWQEIHDALLSGKTCIVHEEFDDEFSWGIVVGVYIGDGKYAVATNNWTALADSANGYPIAS